MAYLKAWFCGGDLRSFIRQVYAYSFFDELIFIYPLYALMFADYGLSPLQISVLFIVWSTTGFLLEVPSGALADKYARKRLLIFAQLVRIAGFSCWMLRPTFCGFLAGFICWGTSGAFCSGTFEALLFDELKHFGSEQSYAKIRGRAGCISTAAIIIASAAACPMMQVGYNLTILASLLSMVLSCVPILCMRSVKRHQSTAEPGYFSLLGQGAREALRNRMIRGLMAFTCFALAFGALDEYWPLMASHAGLPRHMVPLFGGAICAAEAAAGILAHRFERLPSWHFYVGYLTAGTALLAAAVLMRPLALLLVLLFAFVMRVSGVVFEARIQHSISVEARATVLSVEGLLAETGCMPVFLGFGMLAARHGYRAAFGSCAVVMIITGLLYLALRLVAGHRSTA